MRVVNPMIIEKVVGLDLLAQSLKVGPYVNKRRVEVDEVNRGVSNVLAKHLDIVAIVKLVEKVFAHR